MVGLGYSEAGRRDAAAAFEIDAADCDVRHLVLRLDAMPDQSAEVAGALLCAPDATLDHLAGAARILLTTSHLAVRCRRDALGLSGVVAWRGPVAPRIQSDGRDVAIHVHPHDSLSGVSLARLRILCSPQVPGRIRAVLAGFPPVDVRFPALCAYVPNTEPPCEGLVSVLVPVFGGRDATQACLEALAAQACHPRPEVIVVDDACPDPALSASVAARCRREGWHYLRHAENAGFASAINRGASRARGRHLLLLNADAILPPDAIARLRDAGRGDDVGTVVPLSNDGGFTSFPRLRQANPVPSAAEAARLDAAARDAHADLGVDIPSGTAFCMLVTRACWDELGGLALDYGRGYFEDVDLCRRAKRRGYRNLVAAGLYVRHIGAQSFAADKRALVAENARLLRDRFLHYDMDWASFVEADPLRPLRAAIERRVPPAGPVRILAGRRTRLGPALAARAATLSVDGAAVIGLSWTRHGDVALEAAAGGVPQSLSFAAEDRGGLAAYLDALDIRGIAVAEPEAVPGPLLDLLLRTRAPLSIFVAGRAAARSLGPPRPLWSDGAEIVAGDRMVAAALGLAPMAETDPGIGAGAVLPGPRVRIAALVPTATAAPDRLLTALDRRLSAAGGQVIQFGEGWRPARARPQATGAMAPADYADAVRHRRITHLLLPDPDLPFGVIDDLRRCVGLPCAYVDWSGDRLARAAGDLALAEGLPGEAAAAALVAWCGASPDAAERRPARAHAAPVGVAP